MKRTGSLLLFAFVSSLVLALPTAEATTIASYTAGMDPPSNPAEFGESFTTPTGGPWDALTFNFFADAPAVTPEASGTAFLLSQEYLGTPGNLSSSTPGYIAESDSISGGVYLFAPGVTINANTEYWVYDTAPVEITGTTVGVGTPGEHAYGSNGNDFVSLPGSIANFTVSGSPASNAPEPSTWAAVAIAWSFILRRRLR